MNIKDFINKSIILQFVKATSILTLLLLGIYSFLYFNENKSDIHNLEKNEINKLNLQVNEIINDFIFIKKDILFLRDLASNTNNLDCNEGKNNTNFEKEIIQFCKHKELYNHISILDNNGNEVLKCIYEDGNPIIVQKSLLQNKSKRYYFDEIKKIGKKDIYFSKFDLNLEHGAIEKPHNEVIRIGSKITNCKGESIGYIILYYQGKDLVRRTKELNANSSSKIHLIDPKGYFLISPNKNLNWGFMFNSKKDITYAKYYPKAWNIINSKNQGQITTPEGIFTFNTINFKNFIKSKSANEISYFATDDYWKVVSFVSTGVIKTIKEENLASLYIPISSIFILIIVFAYLLSYYKSKDLKSNIEIDKLASVAKNSNNNIVITDIQGNIEWINYTFEKRTGYKIEEVIGKPVQQFLIHPKNNSEIIKQFNDAITFKKQSNLEVISISKSGKQYWLTINIKPLKLGKRNAQEKFIIVGTDITSLKNKEQEIINLNNQLEKRVENRTLKLEKANKELLKNRERLKISKDRLETAFSTGDYAWWEWDFNTQKMIYSSLMSKMVGLKKSEVDKNSLWWTERIHPEDVIPLEKVIEEHVKNKTKSYNTTYRIKHKNGSYIWVNVNGRIESYDKNHNPLKMVGILKDITIIKKAEEEITKAKNAAEQANQAKSDFLANMSHEIRTPMNAIIGFSEQLSNTITDSKQLSQINLIRTSGKNLLRIINDILDLSKIEAGKIEIDPTTVSLKSLGNYIQSIFEQTTNEKGIDFLITFEDDIKDKIIIDEVRTRQILFNLASNAVKFTETGSVKIHFKTIPNNNKIDLIIIVKDTGIGIPENQLKNIFDPFIQSRGQSVIKYGGTGLGLSITSKLVDKMNGSISVSSTINKGSTFTVYIPNIKTSNEDINIEKTAFDTSKVIFNKAKILIADDVIENRKLIIDLLATSPELEFIQASNGKEAIKLAQEELPDIILMDLRMPELNGIEATKIIKSENSTKHIPIIAITASIKNNKEKEKLQILFNEYLTKPLNIELFFKTLTSKLSYATNNSSKLKEKTSTENISLTPHEVNNLPAYIKQVETELLSRLSTLLEEQVINDLEKFGKDLRSISKKHNLTSMIAYSTKVCEYADNFEFDKLINSLKKFPKLIDDLKKQIQE